MSSTEAARPVERDSRLDVLRAVAILAVMVRHLATPSSTVHPWLHDIVTFIRRPAWMGVDLFFVLSGFLVSGLIFREYANHGSVRIGQFLIRRGFKIYPAFYLFLILTFVLGHFSSNNTPEWQDFWIHFAFLQNYAPWTPSQWIHTWSLAVEEHFYLLLSLVAYLWIRRHPRMPTLREASIGLCVVYAVVLSMRLITHSVDAGLSAEAFLRHRNFATHLRVDSLAFGVFLSYVFHQQPLLWARLARVRVPILLTAIALLLPSLFFENEDAFTAVFGFTMYNVAFGGTLIFALTSQPVAHEGPWRKPIIFIGTYSYSIYLWHMLVRRSLNDLVVRFTGVEFSYPVSVVLYFTVSIVLGIAMANLIEIPMLRVRDAMFPSRSRNASNPEAVA